MFFLFANQPRIGEYVFGSSLVFLMISLGLSLREVQVSVDALNYRLRDLEKH